MVTADNEEIEEEGQLLFDDDLSLSNRGKWWLPPNRMLLFGECNLYQETTSEIESHWM
jgi:hypothetical protein